eukprot:12894264-Alexandrium_andersonii.AAC.1
MLLAKVVQRIVVVQNVVVAPRVRKPVRVLSPLLVEVSKSKHEADGVFGGRLPLGALVPVTRRRPCCHGVCA